MIDVTGMFDWKTLPADRLSEIMRQIDDLPEGSVTVGFSIYLDDQGTGGDLLFVDDQKLIYFLATINRRCIEGSTRFTDLGWYIRRLIPTLEYFGLSEVTAQDIP